MTKPRYLPERKLSILAFGLVLWVCAIAPAAHAAKAVSQFGVTWTFDRDYPTGQFANGDYWVVGPVKITSITPRSAVVNGQTIHGSMINPVPNTGQAFDSRIRNNSFQSAKNVARQFPLTVAVNSSLLSSISFDATATGNAMQLQTIAILTVLDRTPPAGSFRPPYAGTDKTIRWNKSNLDYSKLKSLSPVAGTPSRQTAEAWFERPLIELKSDWTGDYLHPASNSPSYGRDISERVGQALLLLQLNYSAAQKEKLLVRLTQWGLDVYGAARNGMKWPGDGGHNHGRKPPLVLAGVVLNDAAIMAYADAKRNFIFQEDQQTFYVSIADVNLPRKNNDSRYRAPYTLAMIGLPEWGSGHTGFPQGDASQWDTSYRAVCGTSMVGGILAVRLMGLESKWNWPPLFDYIDRFYRIESPNTTRGTAQIAPFVLAMWKAYRNLQPSNFTEDNVATEIWQNIEIPLQNGSFTVAFDTVASAAKINGVIGLSSGGASAPEDLIAGMRFAPSGIFEALNGTTYSAKRTLSYAPGVKYRVVATIDLTAKNYSVTITPAGAAAVQIADRWKFRNANITAEQLNNLSFVSTGGYHAVLSAVVNPSPTQLAAPNL